MQFARSATENFRMAMTAPGCAGTNAQTLLAYENHVAEYIEQTSQEVEGAAKEWIDSALVDLPSNAKLLELGSAFGRDAAYIASKGYSIECTDAAENFVSYLRDKGFHARLFNVITDELDGQYDLILASAVMLHFTREELALALRKLCDSLNPRGRLAISLKRGEGDAWSTEKLGAPRYFCYWEAEDLEPVLGAAGFARWTIDDPRSKGNHVAWLYVVATK